VSRFRPALDSSGLFGLESTAAATPMQLTAAVTLSYANNPIAWRYPDSTYAPVVEHQLMVEPRSGLGLFPFIDASVSLPLAPWHSAPQAGLGDIGGAGVGDLRTMVRIEMADVATFGFGTALVMELTAPLGDQERFLGAGGMTFRPRLIAAVPLPISMPFAGLRDLEVSGSIGYLMRPEVSTADITLDDEWTMQAGIEAFLPDAVVPLTAVVEIAAGSGVWPLFEEGHRPVELLAGARVRGPADTLYTIGAAAGLSQSIGSPSFRVVVAAAYEPIVMDSDRDRIHDSVDACVDIPEDHDGFEDDDGCPEADNDRDGVEDDEDECPNEAEVYNGIYDDDGCPDETPDADGDGIADEKDRCPSRPEDIDTIEDEDGCPETDADGDGLLDEEDECPLQPENKDGKDDEDGCPEEPPEDSRVKMSGDRIEISESIQFESGKAVLLPASEELLTAVALLVITTEGISKIRIEGHTDSLGDADTNQRLSQERAEAVRTFLVNAGVEADILDAQGFGESKPIATNDTEEGRAANRRVEFVILQAE